MIMKALEWLRNIVGAALLVCGGVVALCIIGGLLWVPEFLGRYMMAPCWLLTAPLSLAYALLALPYGASWETRLKRSMVMKLLLIPFFVANFILGVAGAAIFFVGGLLFTVIAAVIAFFTLLATSVDVIRALTLMRRAGRMTTGRMACHILLQLIFCADVIDAWVLWANRERYAAPEITGV